MFLRVLTHIIFIICGILFKIQLKQYMAQSFSCSNVVEQPTTQAHEQTRETDRTRVSEREGERERGRERE